jgi:abortive infection bacteriophage resistance protein
MGPDREIFAKRPLTIEEQIASLQTRGMRIPDKERAARYLRFIGYYRLAVYGVPYKTVGDNYAPGATFDNMLDLYIFDRKLRLHYMDAIERVEVAVRTTISNHMALRHGATWFCNPELFQKEIHHKNLLESIRRDTGHPDVARNGSNHRFCNAFYKRYGPEAVPPSWMVAEVLSFGSWSRTFKPARKGRQGSRGTTFQSALGNLGQLAARAFPCPQHLRPPCLLWNTVSPSSPHCSASIPERTTPGYTV